MAKITTHKISGIGATLGQVSVSAGHTLEIDGVVDLTHCSSQALQLPTGTTAQRPNPAYAGYLRWNTDADSETGNTIGLEFYDGSEWKLYATAIPEEDEDDSGDSGGSGGSGTLGTASNPAVNAKELYDAGERTSGYYYINGGSGTARVFYCILSSSWGGGGGWMVIANHDASKYPNQGHQARPTAYGPYVGGDNGVSESGLKPEYSFSCDMTGIPYTKVMHFCYENSSMSTPSTNNWLGNPIVYWYSSFTSNQTIPSGQQSWVQEFNFTGASLTWGGSTMNRRHSYGQYSGNYDCEAWGVMNQSGGGYPYVNGSGGNSQNYPLYIGTWYKSNLQPCYETMSWCDTNSSGYDDWQDGSGQSDNWWIEQTGSKGSSRGKPSMLVVQ